MKRQNEQMLVALLNALAQSTELTEDEKFDAINDIHKDLRAIKSVERKPGEFFKLVPGTTRYYASNLGRVIKITSEGEVECRLIRSKNKTGRYYYDVLIELKDMKTRCRVSRIIAKTWLDDSLNLLYSKEDTRVVDHISEDTLDNSLSNIRVLSQSNNIKRAIYEYNKTVGKTPRKCYAEKDGEYRVYSSTSDLVKDITGSNNNGVFSHAVKYSHKINGWAVGYTK